MNEISYSNNVQFFNDLDKYPLVIDNNIIQYNNLLKLLCISLVRLNNNNTNFTYDSFKYIVIQTFKKIILEIDITLNPDLLEKELNNIDLVNIVINNINSIENDIYFYFSVNNINRDQIKFTNDIINRIKNNVINLYEGKSICNFTLVREVYKNDNFSLWIGKNQYGYESTLIIQQNDIENNQNKAKIEDLIKNKLKEQNINYNYWLKFVSFAYKSSSFNVNYSINDNLEVDVLDRFDDTLNVGNLGNFFSSIANAILTLFTSYDGYLYNNYNSYSIMSKTNNQDNTINYFFIDFSQSNNEYKSLASLTNNNHTIYDEFESLFYYMDYLITKNTINFNDLNDEMMKKMNLNVYCELTSNTIIRLRELKNNVSDFNDINPLLPLLKEFKERIVNINTQLKDNQLILSKQQRLLFDKIFILFNDNNLTLCATNYLLYKTEYESSIMNIIYERLKLGY